MVFVISIFSYIPLREGEHFSPIKIIVWEVSVILSNVIKPMGIGVDSVVVDSIGAP